MLLGITGKLRLKGDKMQSEHRGQYDGRSLYTRFLKCSIIKLQIVTAVSGYYLCLQSKEVEQLRYGMGL
jgi:hypothetical protein